MCLCRHFCVQDSIYTQRWAGSFPLGSIRLAGSGGCVPPGGDFDKAAPPSRCPAPRIPSARRLQRSCSAASASSPAACQWPATPADVGRENKSDDSKRAASFGFICHSLNTFTTSLHHPRRLRATSVSQSDILRFYLFCLFLDRFQFLPRFKPSLSLRAKLKVLSSASHFFRLGVDLHLCDFGPFLPEVWVVEGNVGSVPWWDETGLEKTNKKQRYKRRSSSISNYK